jgi:predicted ArsR family transcriptional regulator
MAVFRLLGLVPAVHCATHEEGTMKVTRERVLRALSRFDVATVAELVEALGVSGSTGKHAVWSRLQQAAANGNVQREGDKGHVARYRITAAGKQSLT